jgi:acetate---CoA ligase (ADP-forming)
MADLALGTRLTYPALTSAQTAGLRAALGPRVALANPPRHHTTSGRPRGADAHLHCRLRPRARHARRRARFPRADRCTSPEWALVVEALRAARDATGVPVALIGSLPETMPENEARRAIDMGIVPFCGMEAAIGAMSAATIGEIAAREPPWRAVLPASRRILTEAEAKADLARFGLAVPRAARAGSPAEAAAAAVRIGFPVVLKGEGFAHKTEFGAVALDLPDAGAVAVRPKRCRRRPSSSKSR